MDWLVANWFWILIFILFIAMHLVGHGGHSGHAGGDRTQRAHGIETDEEQERAGYARSDGHQH